MLGESLLKKSIRLKKDELDEEKIISINLTDPLPPNIGDPQKTVLLESCSVCTGYSRMDLRI